MSDSQTPDGCKKDDTPAEPQGTSWDGPPAGQSPPAKAPEVPGLLAQIPDVAAPAQGSETEAGPGSRDGRILSPGLSAKILFGGGLFLLLVAVMPFVFGRKDDPECLSTGEAGQPKLESPVPLALAPKWEAKTAQTLTHEAVAAAKSRPDNGPTENTPAENVRKQTAPPSAQPQVAIQTGPVRASPGELGPQTIQPPQRHNTPPVPAEVSPPPVRYPSTQYPFAYDAPGREAPLQTNRPMALRDRAMPPVRYDAGGVRRDHQTYPDTRYAPEVADSRRPGVGQADYRDGQGVDGRRHYDRAGPPARVADARQAVRPRYPTTSASPANESGIARFKGIIEKPTARITHDGAGSSVY